MADYADLATDHLIGVADAAVTHQAALDGAMQVSHDWRPIYNPGREQHGTRADGAIFEAGSEQAVVTAKERRHCAGTIWAPYSRACATMRDSNSGPVIPSGNPAWLRERGIHAARLAPPSITTKRRQNRAR